MAVPAFFSHYLGQAITASGTVRAWVYSELDSTDLPTIPENIIEKILPDGYIMKRLSVREEGSELENVTFRYIEDYSVYAEGFFYKLMLGGEWEIQIQLFENGNWTHFCWMRALHDDEAFDELALPDYDDARREGVITFTSAYAARMREVTAEELWDYFNTTNPLYETIGGVRYTTILDIISSALFLAFTQSVDNADITQENECLQYFDGSAWRSFDEMSFNTGTTFNASFLAAFGWTTLDWLRQIFLENVLYPEIEVDVATGDHKIHLVAKGSNHSFSIPALTTEQVPTTSRLYSPFHPSFCRNIKVTNYNGGLYAIYIDDIPTSPSDVPPGTTFDVDLRLLWDIGIGREFFYVSGGVASAVTQIQHWQLSSWSGGTANAPLEVATYLNTHWGPGEVDVIRGYEREYEGLAIFNDGSTVAHGHTKFRVNAWHVINDGVGDINCMAIEIGKDLANNRTLVIWREKAEA